MHKPRLVFLYSDTGGGHRSVAQALIEALQDGYGDAIESEMVDFLEAYAPYPFNRLPQYYPGWVRRPRGWERGYKGLDSPRRVGLVSRAVWPYVRPAVLRFVAAHPADCYVSVHPLANAPLLQGMANAAGPGLPPRLTIVVTDLVSTHAFWFHHRADLTILPTQPAFDQALAYGLPPERLKLAGLPVAASFSNPSVSRETLRARLGWPQDRPTVLLLGGGEGMGRIEENARAIAESGLPVSLAIVTGRNRELKARLEGQSWPAPVFIYGFVDRMHEFMRAAQFLVTKAGSVTISEALIAGLPVILFGFLPGQESGNVSYLADNGAGVWAPEPEMLIGAIQHWLADSGAYRDAVSACRRLARPEAARQIADILASQVGLI